MLDGKVSELLKALRYLHDVVDKAAVNNALLSLLPKSVTVIVDLVTDLTQLCNHDS